MTGLRADLTQMLLPDGTPIFLHHEGTACPRDQFQRLGR